MGLAVLALAAPAQSQTPTTFMSTLDQPRHHKTDIGKTPIAQKFTTGTHPGGYTLSDIVVALRQGSTDPDVNSKLSELSLRCGRWSKVSTSTDPSQVPDLQRALGGGAHGAAGDSGGSAGNRRAGRLRGNHRLSLGPRFGQPGALLAINRVIGSLNMTPLPRGYPN